MTVTDLKFTYASTNRYTLFEFVSVLVNLFCFLSERLDPVERLTAAYHNMQYFIVLVHKALLGPLDPIGCCVNEQNAFLG